MEVAEREEPRGALDGIRVLDVAEPFGAYVSRILGDLGADVLKLEPPGGDWLREIGPFHEPGGESEIFLQLNRNKRGIVVDLSHPIAPTVPTTATSGY